VPVELPQPVGALAYKLGSTGLQNGAGVPCVAVQGLSPKPIAVGQTGDLAICEPNTTDGSGGTYTFAKLGHSGSAVAIGYENFTSHVDCGAVESINVANEPTDTFKLMLTHGCTP
jgi:hypothetical protein